MRSPSTARRFAPTQAGSRSGRAKNSSRSKPRPPSGWLRLSRSFRAIRGLRAVVDKPRGSGRRVMFRRGRQERGRRSNGLRRSARRAPKPIARTRPGRRRRGLRRPIPRRAACAFPTGRFRPAYNAQIAAAPKEGVIVSIEVTDRRNDAGLAGPKGRGSAPRHGATPDRLLGGTHYATTEDIIARDAHIPGPVIVYT